MKKYFVYVIWSEDFKRKYVGMTEDVQKRLNEHNAGKTKSTKSFIPWKIIFVEDFFMRTEAREREKYFNSAAGRKYLKKLLPL